MGYLSFISKKWSSSRKSACGGYQNARLLKKPPIAPEKIEISNVTTKAIIYATAYFPTPSPSFTAGQYSIGKPLLPDTAIASTLTNPPNIPGIPCNALTPHVSYKLNLSVRSGLIF